MMVVTRYKNQRIKMEIAFEGKNKRGSSTKGMGSPSRTICIFSQRQSGKHDLLVACQSPDGAKKRLPGEGAGHRDIGNFRRKRAGSPGGRRGGVKERGIRWETVKDRKKKKGEEKRAIPTNDLY